MYVSCEITSQSGALTIVLYGYVESRTFLATQKQFWSDVPIVIRTYRCMTVGTEMHVSLVDQNQSVTKQQLLTIVCIWPNSTISISGTALHAYFATKETKRPVLWLHLCSAVLHLL